MDWQEICLLGGIFVLFTVMFVYYRRCQGGLRRALLGGLTGIALLYPAQWILTSFGYALSFNLFTIAVSALLGIPGVALLIAAVVF
jgi:hypothetical protein